MICLSCARKGGYRDGCGCREELSMTLRQKSAAAVLKLMADHVRSTCKDEREFEARMAALESKNAVAPS